MLPQTLQTDRLSLRKPVSSDAGELFDADGQAPAVSKYMA